MRHEIQTSAHVCRIGTRRREMDAAGPFVKMTSAVSALSRFPFGTERRLSSVNPAVTPASHTDSHDEPRSTPRLLWRCGTSDCGYRGAPLSAHRTRIRNEGAATGAIACSPANVERGTVNPISIGETTVLCVSCVLSISKRMNLETRESERVEINAGLTASPFSSCSASGITQCTTLG